MGGWLGVGEIILGILVVLALPLVLLAVRRRWLARQGGTFECSMRLRTNTPHAGWVLGMGRYNEENLEWFRFFSYSPRPRRSFVRTAVSVLEVRSPDPIEAVSLYAGQMVVRLGGVDDPDHEWQLAMGPDSLTGMLSWLEAAPPGARNY
jgi:hypothetical protein